MAGLGDSITNKNFGLCGYREMWTYIKKKRG